MESENNSKTRYVGIDLKNHSYEMAIVGKQGKLNIYSGKMNAAGRQILYRKLRAADKVAMKTETLSFVMAREIEASVGCQMYVVDPVYLPLVNVSVNENDIKDSMKLAYVFNGSSEEWLVAVTPLLKGEMHLRELHARCNRERHSRNIAITRLHALFVSFGKKKMLKKNLQTALQRQAAIQLLEGPDLKEAQHLLNCLELYEQRIMELEKEIQEKSEERSEMRSEE